MTSVLRHLPTGTHPSKTFQPLIISALTVQTTHLFEPQREKALA